MNPESVRGPKPLTKLSRGCYSPDEIERLCDRLLKSAHPEQEQAVLDPGHFVSILTARGAGKTTTIILRMLRKMVRIRRCRCVFIATTRESARLLVWDDLKDVIEKLGIQDEVSFGESRLTVTFGRNGSTLRLVGADDEREIDKLRGKSYHEVAIDEAASHPNKILERLIERVIGPRLGDTDGCIVLVGTPGHQLIGLFYDATRPGSSLHRRYTDRANQPTSLWSSHAWNMEDAAPHVPAIARLWERALADKLAAGWGDDHPIWRREYMGQWAADDTENIYAFKAYDANGAMWNIWDPERVGPMRIAKLPDGRKDWLFSFGADIGGSDPFSLEVYAASPSDPERMLYHVFEFESAIDTKMYSKRIAELLFGEFGKDGPNHKKPSGLIGALGWPAGAMMDIAGTGDLILNELADIYGFRFEPAPRAAGDKMAAIELFNGDLVEGRIKVMKGSKLATQLASLQWIADEFGKVKEDKRQPNHSTDASVYARRKLANVFESYAGTPLVTTPAAIASVPRQRGVVERDDADEKDTRGFENDALGVDGFDDSWGNG